MKLKFLVNVKQNVSQLSVCHAENKEVWWQVVQPYYYGCMVSFHYRSL